MKMYTYVKAQDLQRIILLVEIFLPIKSSSEDLVFFHLNMLLYFRIYFYFSSYIYIYIYVCVCVCVCVEKINGRKIHTNILP